MGSPFKMKPKSPMMKALVGKQGNLPQHLQDAIKAAPETSKKGSPVKKTTKPTDKNRATVGKDSKDVVLSEKDSINRRRPNRNSGKADFERVTQTVEKGSRAPRGTTMSDRQGAGRIGTKTYERFKGNKGQYAMVGSTVSGAKGTRKLADGTEVLKEATVSKVKKKGVKRQTIKGKDITKDLKARAPRKTQKAIQVKKAGVKTTAKMGGDVTNELKKKRTAGKSPARSYGSKKKSPVMKRGVKGLKMQRGKK